jgi:hypothetical protein
MCRLYGFRATEPTKIECTLVHAQNALIIQSYRDQSGTSHLNGWVWRFTKTAGCKLYDRRQQPLMTRISAVSPAVPIPRPFWRMSGARRSAESL